jgi:hypothetical protein
MLAAIGLSQAATPNEPLFVEDLRAGTMQVSRRAEVFKDMLTRMGGVDRVEMNTITRELTTTVTEFRARLAAFENPPAEVTGVVAVLDLALQAWMTGAQGFETHVLAAADGDPSLVLVDLVLEDLLELRAGDRLYRVALEALAAANITQPVSPMPEIRFLPDSYPIVPGAQTVVAQARAAGSPLTLFAALVIEQVTTLPEWVLDTEGTLVVDATDQMAVRVIVTNAGNSMSEPTQLTAEIAGGDGSAHQETLDVPALAAGAKTTITFEPAVVTPGRSYSLLVRLALAPGEGATADNSRTLPFRVNDGSVTTTTTAG